jgi:hypothetical protein
MTGPIMPERARSPAPIADNDDLLDLVVVAQRRAARAAQPTVSARAERAFQTLLERAS